MSFHAENKAEYKYIATRQSGERRIHGYRYF